jgi:hypothetical protein
MSHSTTTTTAITTTPIQCRCGTLRGTLARPQSGARVICYCRDCQTYAHALGGAEAVLDAQGGTTIVAALQPDVRFTQGVEQLACLSLTERGVYRWYAASCRTPIANTIHKPEMPYVGLVHSALGPTREAVDRQWPAHFTVNTTHAKGPVQAPGARAFFGTLGIMRRVIVARLSGAWRRSPFFVDGSRQAVVTRRVLSAEELQRARDAV